MKYLEVEADYVQFILMLKVLLVIIMFDCIVSKLG